MKVFISHQQGDSEIAKETSGVLASFGIDSYLDVIDDSFVKIEDVASKIQNEMDKCTQVLVIISEANRNSFWVPWEVGVATAKNLPLATLSVKGARPHEFLEKWPLLRTVRDFEIFVFAIRETERLVETAASYGLFGSGPRTESQLFYKLLRDNLQ